MTIRRRKYVEGCPTCERERESQEAKGRPDPKDWFAPYHDASERCQSGGHPHCTCDTCF